MVFALLLTIGTVGVPGQQASSSERGVGLPSGAQECGSWREPVLCQSVLRYTDGIMWSEVGPEGSMYLAPLASLELEVSGRDQFGRAFPQERLHLDFDARGCAAYLNAERRSGARVRVTALAAAGSCRLELWVPGNLNHAWSLQVVVAAPERTEYNNAEATLIVNSLYRGLFDRDPDPNGLSHAVAEVERGNLQSWVQSMTRSDEFRAGRGAMNPPDVLDHLYRALFGTSVDSAGTQAYMPRIRDGQYAEVVLALLRSPEFERRLANAR